VVPGIADEVYLTALTLGVTDPETEVMELANILDKGSSPAKSWNQLAGVVEDEDVPGIEQMSREQRGKLFERAFKVATEANRDRDALEAFDRLMRFYWDEGAFDAIRETAGRFVRGWKPLRLPSLITLLEVMVLDGEPSEGILQPVESFLATKPESSESDTAIRELQLLGQAHPRHHDQFLAFVEKRATKGKDTVISFPEKRVLLVGGHDSIRTGGKPILEEWGLKVDWLGPHEAKNGKQAISLAQGACDAVIINTAYIGHAASGRVKEAAEAANKPVVWQDGRGLASVLQKVRETFAQSDAASRPMKVADKRKRAGL
jgi:hypothetical protein